MAFSQEQMQKAIAAAIGTSGRFSSYELDDDLKLTANFKSNSGQSDRQVYIDFDRDEAGEYSGHMNCSQSEYYPGDSAGWGLARHITDALNNPEDYENLDYDDKQVYPSDDDSEEHKSVNDARIIAGISLAAAAVAGLIYGVYKLGKHEYFRLRDKRLQKTQSHDSTDGSKDGAMAANDSPVETIQNASSVAIIFKELPEDTTLEQFEEAFDKARELDLRSLFFYIKEHKEKFTPEMVKYAQNFYEKEI